MASNHQLVFDIDSMNETDAIVNINYSYHSKSVSAQVEVTNPVREGILKKMQWYYEHSGENSVHISSVETEIINEGTTLFNQLFNHKKTKEIWKLAKSNLASLDIIVTDKDGATYLFPWEIMYDETNKEFLVTRADRFIRTVTGASAGINTVSEKLRVLLVIARPMTFADIAVSTIANAIIGEFNEDDFFHFTVLRPPTFEHLCDTLQSAKSKGTPFHFVHFDGHGVHGSQGIPGLNVSKGYLMFENAGLNSHVFIDGQKLGKVLQSSGVRTFIMNACRSGYINHDQDTGRPGETPNSLAHDILAEGIDAVIGMRYEVEPFTARRFAKAFYKLIATNKSVDEAFNDARKELVYKEKADTGLRMFDLFVPVLVRRRDLRFKKPSLFGNLSLKKLFVKKAETASAVNIFDDLLIQFEKLSYQHPLIQVYGAMGSGKTSFFKELERWSKKTNLVDQIEKISVKEGQSFSEVIKMVSAIIFEKRTLVLIDDIDKGMQDSNGFLENLYRIRDEKKGSEIIFALSVKGKNSIPGLDDLPAIQVYVADKLYFKTYIDSYQQINNEKNVDLPDSLLDFIVTAAKGNLEALRFFSIVISKIDFRHPGFKDTLYQLFFASSILSTEEILKRNLAALDSREMAGVSILSMVHAGFSQGLAIDILTLAAGFDAAAAKDLLQRLQNAGFFIEIVDDCIFQLHPEVVGFFNSIFQKQFPVPEQKQIILSVLQLLKKEIDVADDFIAQILLANLPFIALSSLYGAIAIDHYPILYFYQSTANHKDLASNLWVEYGWLSYKEKAGKNDQQQAEEFLINKLGFTFYYLQLCSARLKYEEACDCLRLLGDFNALAGRISQMPDPSKQICLKLLADSILLFGEFESLLIKVRSDLESEFTESFKSAIQLLFEVFHAAGDNRYCARIKIFQAKLSLHNIKNVDDWYFQIISKQYIFRNKGIRHPSPEVNYYFDNVKHFRPKHSKKQFRYLKKVGNSFIASDNNLAEELEEMDLGQLIFGKQYLQSIVVLKGLLEEAAQSVDGDPALTEDIDRLTYELKLAIQSKCEFYLLDIYDVMLLIESSIHISIESVAHLLQERKKGRKMTGDDLHLQSVIKNIFKELQLSPPGEAKAAADSFADLFVFKDDYHKAIGFLERQEQQVSIENFVPYIIQQLETMSIMYHMCDRSSNIQFYTTPVFTYLGTKLDMFLHETLIRIFGEEYKFKMYERLSSPIFQETSGEHQFTQWDFLSRITNELSGLKDMIDAEKAFHEKTELLLDKYFKLQGQLTSSGQILNTLRQTDELLAMHAKLRRPNVELITQEMTLISMQASCLIDYCKDFATGNTDQFVEQIEILGKMQKTIVSLTPFAHIPTDPPIASVLESLKEAFVLYFTMFWEIIVYYIYTEDEKRDLTANERKMVLGYSDIVLAYFDDLKDFVNIPILDTLIGKGSINHSMIAVNWKLEYLSKELMFYTRDRHKEATPWPLLEQIDATVKDVETHGGKVPELMAAVLYEYRLHWSIVSCDGLLEKLQKNDPLERGRTLELLAYCYNIIIIEFGSESSGISDVVPFNMRLPLVRNANRQILRSLCDSMEPGIKQAAADAELEHQKNLQSIESDLINN